MPDGSTTQHSKPATAHQAESTASTAHPDTRLGSAPQALGTASTTEPADSPPASPDGDGHGRPDIARPNADRSVSAPGSPLPAPCSEAPAPGSVLPAPGSEAPAPGSPLPAPCSEAPAPCPEPPVLRIYPTGGWRSLDLREVWRYRELMLTLAWREISIRYKQTALGAAWAVIQPLMTTGIFSVLFALLMGRGNEPTPEGIPYVVSTFCAMLPWQLFAHSLNQSGNILVQYRAMITKIYFPRLILPAAAVLSTLVDFAVALVALLALMLLYGVSPSWGVLFLPGFIVLALVSSLAVGLWLAAMNAIYRDFRYVIPFIVQIGMFISPVVYSTDSIRHRLPDWALTLYALNPMAGVIEGFRWALLGTARAPGIELALSAAAATAILIGGMFYFRRMERTIADLI